MASTFSFAAPPGAAPTTSGAAFSFGGGGGATTPTPAAPTFGAAGAPPTAAGNDAAAAPSTDPPSQPSVTVPNFDDAFPFLKIKSKLRELLPKSMDGSREGTLAGQELMEILRSSSDSTSYPSSPSAGPLLAKPTPLQWVKPDMALRHKIQTDPHVVVNGATATLTTAILQEIYKVSDDLRISEVQAMSLYAQAARPETIAMLEGQLDRSYVDSVMRSSDNGSDMGPVVLGHDFPRAARELFFFERGQCLESVLLIAQQRLRAMAGPGGVLLMSATNQLVRADLMPHLISAIREWSQMAELLEKEIDASSSTQSVFGSMRGTNNDNRLKPSFARVHLAFAYQQRQRAAECLFFLAYHTQCNADEVAGLVDLIKDLTNGSAGDEKSGLPLLDPLRDVPRAYHNTVMPSTPIGSPFTSAAPPLREKNPIEWNAELVDGVWQKGGKPQLLQCVSVLVVSVICALDARQELIDRHTNFVNEFGKGNALLPPRTDVGPVSTAQLLPVHQRLNPTKETELGWKRTDIWGIMVASYALLLPSVMASPRLGIRSPGSPRHGPIDIKSTWWQCLSRPSEFKSFTFARLSLMPAFQRHTGTLDTYEFFMSVLSEFMSHYLDVMFVSGDVPISQAQWERSEEQDLQLRRDQQEQQRQFRAWSGTATIDEEIIPSSVDLLSRPDCMDDVMAFATAICATGPAYSRLFWSTCVEEGEDGQETIQLVPSRALQKLEVMQEADESLRPIYVSFLAGLALAYPPEDVSANGAAVVNEILSRESTSTKQITWISLCSAIRWYTRRMSPGDYYSTPDTTTKDSSTTNTSSLQGKATTAYYYGAEDNGVEGSEGYESRRERSRSTSGSTAPRPKEMGEVNNAILLSHLSVITTIATNLPSARAFLVTMKLAVKTADSSSFAGEDPLLTVLILLALAPLTPIVRGAVFTTVSALLNLDDTDAAERRIMENMTGKTWELIETCRFLPISHLDQFEFYPDSNARDAQGMVFPPSSTSMVGDESKDAWLPAEAKYSIIFEMEHIESRMGFYPSTEGFLCLLAALFSSGGMPPLLGKDTRARTGCTPFIEYVVFFVLPRAVGTKEGCSSLPFRLPCDRSRLVARALDVVSSVLSRYPVPRIEASIPLTENDLQDHGLALEEATEITGLSTLADRLLLPVDERDTSGFVYDYHDCAITNAVSNGDPASGGLQSTERAESTSNTEMSLPRVKSPGFTVLAALLSSSYGEILLVLTQVLVRNGAQCGIREFFGASQYKQDVANALFGQTYPSLSVARASEERSVSLSTQSLIMTLSPPAKLLVSDFDDGVLWQEKCVATALRLLCAGAVREDRFRKAVSARGSPLSITPVMSFKAKSLPAQPLMQTEVHISKVSSLLVSSAGTLPAVIQYLWYEGASRDQDSDIADGALGLLEYICQVLPASDTLSAFCGIAKMDQFSQAIAMRLYLSCLQTGYPGNRDRASLILDIILREMRNPVPGELSLSHVLLGLSSTASAGTHFRQVGFLTPKIGKLKNCLDATLDLLADDAFCLSPNTSLLASRCFEVVYRLSRLASTEVSATSQYIASRLRIEGFWTQNLLRFFGTSEKGGRSILASAVENKNEHSVLHCAAWLLKGVSNELSISHRRTHGLFQAGWHESSYSQKLLAILFSREYGLVLNIVSALPTAMARFEDDRLSALATRVVQRARKKMRGASEVTAGYNVVDVRKVRRSWASCQSTEELGPIMSWAESFNENACWDCASSHLAGSLQILFESSIFLLDAVVAEQGTNLSVAPPRSLPSFDLQTLIDILLQLVYRILDKPETLSSAVAYNLCYIASLLVEQICKTRSSFEVRIAGLEGNLARIAGRVSKALTTLALSREHSATVLLGTALASMVRAAHQFNPSEDLATSVTPAVMALGRIALRPMNESDSQPVLLARTCITLLLDFFVDEQDDTKVIEILNMLGGQGGLLESFISLLPSLEVEVCLAIQKIALFQGGTPMLLRARVLTALGDSAAVYMEEERRLGVEYLPQDGSIQTPNFFAAHVCLLTTLISSTEVAVHQRGQVSGEVVGCLLAYTPMICRLFRSFPAEGDVLLECVECFSFACEDGGLEAWTTDPRVSHWEKAILGLSRHVSVNPLPRRFLSGLPFPLKSTSSEDPPSKFVSFSADDSSDVSWWDALEKADMPPSQSNRQLPDPPSLNQWYPTGANLAGPWTVQKYEFAIYGLRLLTACFAFIALRLQSHSLPLRVEWTSLARGLISLADIARATEGRIHVQTAASTPSAMYYGDQTIEREYLDRLGSMAGSCAEQILGIFWHKLRSLPDENGGKRQYRYLESIALALDHAKIAVMGIGCVPLGTDDSNRRAMSKDLAADLRVMLTSLEGKYGES